MENSSWARILADDDDRDDDDDDCNSINYID